ncbi:MAG: efflux RND transporter permease subunit [Candidatus Krumholzibacteriota bacterium]|nr:efflux RND transporter permease subunit [Candidatus Krumholzibacteriota bacterium]
MTRFFLRHPVSTWMVFAAFLVMGLYALPKLKIEAIPEVDLPSLSVETTWNGASPQAIQRSITLPVEEAARRLPGVESVTSTSRPGRSVVEVSFRRGTDLEFARLELSEQIGALRRDLPLGARQPQIRAYVPEEFRVEQFFSFSLDSPLAPNELRQRAETWILPRLLAVSGVADAQVMGGARPLLRVRLDRERLDLYGIGAGEVFAALAALDDIEASGAVSEDGLEKAVSLREEVSLERIASAVVARRGDRCFRLDQLAELDPGHEDLVYIVRADGRNVVQLAVEKRSGANTVGVSKALRDLLPVLEASLPFDARFHIDADQGQDLEDKLWELVYRSLVILGLLFLLMAISLRQVKLTGIVVGSIFFAILISLSLFYFLRLSVNFITISGLTVSFGLLLDNSILVLDGIHRRVQSLGGAGWAELDRRGKLAVATQAIVAGTSEVSFPILATTLTTLVVFAAFIFLSGRLALYYVPLAVAVATALLASLFVAFGWLPVVLEQGWARPLVNRLGIGSRRLADEAAVARFVEEQNGADTAPGWFERVLQWLQRFWWLVLPPVAAAIVWGFVWIYPNKVIKGGFFRMPDREQLFLYLQMPEGTDVKVTSEILGAFEEKLQPVPAGARMLARCFDNRGFLDVEFEDDLLRTEIPSHYRALLVEQADITGGSSVYIRGFADQPYFRGTFGGVNLNSTIRISGYNSRRLHEIADGVLARLQRNRRVRHPRVTSGMQYERAAQDETVINIDRQRLAEHGLSATDLVRRLQLLLGVDLPWTLLLDGRQQQAQLFYTDAETMEYDLLLAQLIDTPFGGQVRLDDLIEVATIPTRGSVVREDQRYTVYINWEYVGTDRMRRATILRALDALELPYGYEAEEAEQTFISEEEQGELNLMLILAGVFIFMVLAALFESVPLPFLVLSSLPMAMLGVFIAFWMTRAAFDSSARIGLVLVFGIVVNNAILLVSRYRHEAELILRRRLGGDPGVEAALFPGLRRQLGGWHLRRLAMPEAAAMLRRAVARGTHVRLRSILLTSGTTIVGLAPLLVHFKPSDDRDIWENLALSSIGGLAASTLLLILAMPPLYYVCTRFAWWVARVAGRLWHGARRKPEPAPAHPAA